MGRQINKALGGQPQIRLECRPLMRSVKGLAPDWKYTSILRRDKTHWPIKATRRTCQSDNEDALLHVCFDCAGLNGSLCPALSAAFECFEGTSCKLHFLRHGEPIMGRGWWLSRRSWGGGSSLGLDGKHQPEVATCAVPCGAPHLLDQTMTSE